MTAVDPLRPWEGAREGHAVCGVAMGLQWIGPVVDEATQRGYVVLVTLGGIAASAYTR